MLKHALLLLAALSAVPAWADDPVPPAVVVPDGAAAVVNGEPIPMADLQALLLRRHGADALREMVFQKLIDQASARHGIEVADAEIARRRADAEAEVTRKYAGAVSLLQMLKAQGVTEEEFRRQVRTRLCLEKLVVRDRLCAAWVKLRIVAAMTEERAADLRRQLAGGADFAKLAETESTDGSAAHGGDLGVRYRGEVLPELEEAAFSLPVGALTPVTKTPMGFLVARVEARQEAKERPAAEIRAELEEAIAKEPPSQDDIERCLGRLRRAARIATAEGIAAP